jgi:hypothetical protein
VYLTLASWVMVAMGLLGQQPASSSPASPASTSLNFDVFKAKIQPIFLARRPGHARCVTCHSAGTSFRLQPLDPGATAWTEEESAKNFQAVRRVVVPGSLKSRLLLHPLAEEAGGDFFHSGGKHWSSQNDPEWQTIRAWVVGETANGSK